MYKNLWNKTKFMCSYRHKPSELTIHEGANGASPFYSCPHYYKENRDPDEDRACPMRLTFIDAEKILDEFSKIMNEDLKNNIVKDYEGTTFVFNKKINVKVVKDNNEELVLDILNKKALS